MTCVHTQTLVKRIIILKAERWMSRLGEKEKMAQINWDKWMKGGYLLSHMWQNDEVIYSDVEMEWWWIDEEIEEKRVNVSVTELMVSVRVSDRGLFVFFLVCHLDASLFLLCLFLFFSSSCVLIRDRKLYSQAGNYAFFRVRGKETGLTRKK